MHSNDLVGIEETIWGAIPFTNSEDVSRRGFGGSEIQDIRLPSVDGYGVGGDFKFAFVQDHAVHARSH